MKDPRFVDDANWTQANERGRALGMERLRALAHEEALLIGVRALLAEDDHADVTRDLPTTVADDVKRFVRGLDVRTDAAWFAIAKSLATVALAGAPSPARLMEAASRLEGAPQWVHHAFEEEAVSLLGGLDAETRESWLALFAAPPRLESPDLRTPVAPIHVARHAADWTVLDPFELWDEGGAAIPFIAGYVPLNMLRRFDEPRWFRTVDSWEDGRLVFAALFGSHVRHDREALFGYIAAAALVFDGVGQWTGRTAALVLVQSLIEHASALANAVRGVRRVQDSDRDDAVAKLATDELPAFFALAWRSLLARADGLALAAAMHVHLVDAHRVRGAYHVDVLGIAHRALSESLSQLRPPLALLRTLWQLRRDAHVRANRPGHVSALRAFACAIGVAKQDQNFEGELVDWLATLLRDDPSHWNYFARGGALPGLLEQVAALLAISQDMVPKLEALYLSFEPSRRRGEFGRTHAENDADYASIVLSVLLVRVLDRRVAGEGGALAVVAERVYCRALRLFLVSSPAFDPTLSARAALTLAIELRARVSPSTLSECIRPVLTDPCHTAEVAVALLPTVGRDEIQRIVAPLYGDLPGLAMRALEWAVATGLPRERNVAEALEIAIRS